METGAWCAMSMGLPRDTAEHVCTSQLQDGLVREGGAALPFAPSGIPLELKQERWAAEALLPVNKKKRGRGFQRADEPYPSRVSSLPCCVEGKEVKRERIRKRRDKESHAQDIPGGSVAKNPCSPNAGSPS